MKLFDFEIIYSDSSLLLYSMVQCGFQHGLMQFRHLPWGIFRKFGIFGIQGIIWIFAKTKFGYSLPT